MKGKKEMKSNSAKDSGPSLGIFEVIDGQVYVNAVPLDMAQKMQADANHAAIELRLMFHQDLAKAVVKAGFATKQSADILSKNNFSNWRVMPRGRVWYDGQDKAIRISSCIEVLRDARLVASIKHLFGLEGRQDVILTQDEEYELVKED